MKKLIFLWLLSTGVTVDAQTSSHPKLVVGIVVDQMRWDYLYRFRDRYSPDGFNRLVAEGFSCDNTLIPYIPTYTAPGHTCIYTGSVPSLHGIIGNNWYDRTLRKSIYCTYDSTASTVGSSSDEGKQSPHNLWASTITDQLRLSSNFRSKVIAIALKERASVLPGGHTANAAYWLDNASGNWITSSYYMRELPLWVQSFNKQRLPDVYLKEDWMSLYATSTYIQSSPYNGKGTLLHNTHDITRNKYDSLRYTPSGNTLTIQFAKAAIENENLGAGKDIDFLALSFSSTDYIGHLYGPNSIEIEDTYLRLDKDLGEFLKYLDSKIGQGNYLLFLTADHGAAHVPNFSGHHNLPSGKTTDANFKTLLNAAILQQLNISNAVAVVINSQVYLDYDSLRQQNGNATLVSNFIIRELLKDPAISKAFDLHDVNNATLPAEVKSRIVNGYNQKLSGDVGFILKPEWMARSEAFGTTHGTWYNYDAHIPLFWFGWQVKQGRSNREVYMTDIAPTVATMLHIQMPDASVGKVIEEALK